MENDEMAVPPPDPYGYFFQGSREQLASITWGSPLGVWEIRGPNCHLTGLTWDQAMAACAKRNQQMREKERKNA